jgi:oxalyl-CoA decarboxylase
VSATELDSNRPIAAPLCGDIASVFSALLAGLDATPVTSPTAWTSELAAKKSANVEKFAARLAAAADRTPMAFEGALGVINQVVEDNPGVMFVNEGANTLDLARDVVDMHLPRHRLDTGTWGVMGVGMGYAIAAAVETGEKVIALEGDSAFGFSGMELETICRYGLPIVVVVFNNGGIYKGDDVNRDPSSTDPAPTVLDAAARYDKLIEAFGGTGYDVKDPAGLDRALRAALDAGTPALINVAIDPTAGTESGHLSHLNPTTST